MGKIWQPYPDDISCIPNWFTVYGWKGQIDGCMLCFDNYRVLQRRFSKNRLLLLGMFGSRLQRSINRGSGNHLQSSTELHVKYSVGWIIWQMSPISAFISSLRPTFNHSMLPHTRWKDFRCTLNFIIHYALNILPWITYVSVQYTQQFYQTEKPQAKWSTLPDYSKTTRKFSLWTL